MTSQQPEAAGAAWKGADLERTIAGEDPDTGSSDDAERWVVCYAQLVKLEQELLDVLAGMIPNMPADARREAEETNLPVLMSQLERFRHRLEYWKRRKRELQETRPA